MKKYSTPKAFRTALEERLKNICKEEKLELERTRIQITFDRLLARLFKKKPPIWVLKGGYSLELQFDSARATRDIDLTLRNIEDLESNGRAEQNQLIADALRDAANVDLGDFFEFQIGDSTMDLENAPYGGGRFPVNARMDGRTFAKFHIDIGVGDSCIEPFKKIAIKDWLAFAGIPTESVLSISREQQFAEKLHAYTLPRERNSRVKDLVDMLLLVSRGELESDKVKSAVTATFDRRNTHDIPSTLMPPPQAWGASFSVSARECNLPDNMGNAFLEIQNFFSTLVKKENKK